MGFYTGYNAVHAVAGLGRLTVQGSNAPSKEAKRVVAAFVRGEPARGSCTGKAGDRVCEIVSSGRELKVGDLLIARHDVGSPNVNVCIPANGEMVQQKSGKLVEAQKSKDVRATAAALMQKLATGIGVRTDKMGVRRLVGRANHSALVAPGACVNVRLNKKQLRTAVTGFEASTRAQREAQRPFPDRKAIDKAMKAIAHERDVARMEKARAARFAKSPKGIAAAAKAAAEAAQWAEIQRNVQRSVEASTRARSKKKRKGGNKAAAARWAKKQKQK